MGGGLAASPPGGIVFATASKKSLGSPSVASYGGSGRARRPRSGELIISDWLVLGGFLAACFLAATSGAYFRPGAWYRGLNKPSWNPPDWLFPPAWTLLYILIAVSGWLLWREAGFAGAPFAFAAYVVQLVLNALWSALFFGLRRIDLGFVDAVAMWLAIAVTISLFAPISPLAALLLVPYLAWVSFATLLNLAIWRRNPAAG